MDFQTRWYHDTTTKSCQEFKYGGCLANENNFNSKASCIHFCWSYLSDQSRVEDETVETSTTEVVSVSTTGDVCRLVKREGVVCGKVGGGERWYFENGIRACQKFLYRGCDGNGNNFASLDECEEKCEGNAYVLDISTIRSND